MRRGCPRLARPNHELHRPAFIEQLSLGVEESPELRATYGLNRRGSSILFLQSGDDILDRGRCLFWKSQIARQVIDDLLVRGSVR